MSERPFGYTPPTKEQSSAFYDAFFKLDKYKKERGYPQLSHIVTQDSYQDIEEMSFSTLPFIVAKLDDVPELVYALERIVGRQLTDRQIRKTPFNAALHQEDQVREWKEWADKNGFTDKQLELGLR